MPNIVQNMPCKDQMTKGVFFCPGYPIRRQCVELPGHTSCQVTRLWQAYGSTLHMNQISTRLSYFTWGNRGKHQWGFLHTHLSMFWDQSSVEHWCCQQLLLHAHQTGHLKKYIYTRWLEYDLFILGQVQLVFIAVTASVLIRTLQNMKANKVLVTCKLILLWVNIRSKCFIPWVSWCVQNYTWIRIDLVH